MIRMKVMKTGCKKEQDIPDFILIPLTEKFKERAMRNHSQTLQRLNERGGLSPGEMYCVLEDIHWREMPKSNEVIKTYLNSKVGLCDKCGNLITKKGWKVCNRKEWICTPWKIECKDFTEERLNTPSDDLKS